MAVQHVGGASVPIQSQSTEQSIRLSGGSVSPAFLLVHAATGWTHSDEHGWRPRLGHQQIRAGIMGAYEQGEGEAATVVDGPLVNTLTTLGRTVIRHNDQRLGASHREWLCRVRTTSGGFHYHAKWESYATFGSRVKAKVDHKVLNAFTDHLLAKNIIDPMPYEVLEMKLDIVDDRIMNGNERNTDKYTTKRDKMLADWEKQFGKKDGK